MGLDMKSYVGSIKEIRKVDDHTIDIITHTPFPILPDVIGLWRIMSTSWSERHDAVRPVDVRKGTDNYASSHANGTGPFMLKSPGRGVRTVLEVNPKRLGPAGAQPDRGDLHPDRQRRDARRGARLGRDRHDAAGAAAGCRSV